MTDKPSKITLKSCIICHIQQDWHPDGYVVTKGWHTIRLQTSGNAQSNFGNSLNLHYPALVGDNADVVCKACIPAAVERYIKGMDDWS